MVYELGENYVHVSAASIASDSGAARESQSEHERSLVVPVQQRAVMLERIGFSTVSVIPSQSF